MKTDIIAKLHPFSFLRDEFQSVVKSKTSTLDGLSPNAIVFNKGEEKSAEYYLLKGNIELETEGGKKSTKKPSSLNFSSGIETYSASAKTLAETVILKVALDSHELNTLLCWEFALRFLDNPQWGFSLYESEMFEHIAPSKLILFLQSLEEKHVETDEIIISENEYGKLFFVMCEGLANVFQGKISEDAKPVSQITPFQTFGEASLISDLPRNASIKMADKGKLMAFDSENLPNLTSEDISSKVVLNKSELKAFLQKDKHFILDIRPEKESKLSAMKGSISAPVDQPLDLLSKIESDCTYVILSPYEGVNKLVYRLGSLKNKNLFIFNLD